MFYSPPHIRDYSDLAVRRRFPRMSSIYFSPAKKKEKDSSSETIYIYIYINFQDLSLWYFKMDCFLIL